MSQFVAKIAVLLCLAAVLLFGAQALAESPRLFSPDSADAQTDHSENTPRPSILISDSGKNITEMNYTLYTPYLSFGFAGVNIGEAVRFRAPRDGWQLRYIVILGWSGFNTSTKTIPPDGNFLLEVRDNSTKLLYKFADTQNYYFASPDRPVVAAIEVPPIKLTGDFYVTFYDRGNMFIGAELGNGTGNSYFVANGQLLPAELKTPDNETVKVNWLIRAIGE
ncbi:MAG: hypothetical protein QFX31_04465 [Methanothrix sp.]|uniref:hypothetical protein n=1 Tax=Methanothrix sp. TaxID=90426 RepID=UPI0032AEE294|nr:hypothetical protein [Methanothrix sp.]